jgi:hypothetical protein
LNVAVQFSGVDHRSESVFDVNQLFKALVKGHDSTAASHGFKRVTSPATAHIENQISRLCSQPVVVNREHY